MLRKAYSSTHIHKNTALSVNDIMKAGSVIYIE